MATDCWNSIHPPNVVLIHHNSNPSLHNDGDDYLPELDSPLSSPPSSPDSHHARSIWKCPSDDEGNENEGTGSKRRRLLEIPNLTVQKSRRSMSMDAPFDEGTSCLGPKQHVVPEKGPGLVRPDLQFIGLSKVKNNDNGEDGGHIQSSPFRGEKRRHLESPSSIPVLDLTSAKPKIVLRATSADVLTTTANREPSTAPTLPFDEDEMDNIFEDPTGSIDKELKNLPHDEWFPNRCCQKEAGSPLHSTTNDISDRRKNNVSGGVFEPRDKPPSRIEKAEENAEEAASPLLSTTDTGFPRRPRTFSVGEKGIKGTPMICEKEKEQEKFGASRCHLQGVDPVVTRNKHETSAFAQVVDDGPEQARVKTKQDPSFLIMGSSEFDPYFVASPPVEKRSRYGDDNPFLTDALLSELDSNLGHCEVNEKRLPFKSKEDSLRCINVSGYRGEFVIDFTDVIQEVPSMLTDTSAGVVSDSAYEMKPNHFASTADNHRMTKSDVRLMCNCLSSPQSQPQKQKQSFEEWTKLTRESSIEHHHFPVQNSCNKNETSPAALHQSKSVLPELVSVATPVGDSAVIDEVPGVLSSPRPTSAGPTLSGKLVPLSEQQPSHFGNLDSGPFHEQPRKVTTKIISREGTNKSAAEFEAGSHLFYSSSSLGWSEQKFSVVRCEDASIGGRPDQPCSPVHTRAFFSSSMFSELCGDASKLETCARPSESRKQPFSSTSALGVLDGDDSGLLSLGSEKNPAKEATSPNNHSRERGKTVAIGGCWLEQEQSSQDEPSNLSLQDEPSHQSSEVLPSIGSTTAFVSDKTHGWVVSDSVPKIARSASVGETPLSEVAQRRQERALKRGVVLLKGQYSSARSVDRGDWMSEEAPNDDLWTTSKLECHPLSVRTKDSSGVLLRNEATQHPKNCSDPHNVLRLGCVNRLRIGKSFESARTASTTPEDEPPSLRRPLQPAGSHLSPTETTLSANSNSASTSTPSPTECFEAFLGDDNGSAEKPAQFEPANSAALAASLDGASRSPSKSAESASARNCESTGGLIQDINDVVKELDAFVLSSPKKTGSSPCSISSSFQPFANPEVDPNISSLTQQTKDTAELRFDNGGDGRLILVSPINNDIGIPKGDLLISLLNEDTETTWSTRVQEAIWRGRTMRRNFDTSWLLDKVKRKPGSPSRGRTSIPIDVDEVRVAGESCNVQKAQTAALEHLKYDDLDDALALYEDIILCYYQYYDDVLGTGTSNKTLDPTSLEGEVAGSVLKFKRCIGAALHNIGIVHLLRGAHLHAFTYFERATLNRATCQGTGDVDHISSMVKMATCRLALEDLEGAVTDLKVACQLSRENAESISDYRQLAEILNNLGCLSFAFGQNDKAMKFFEESLEVQSTVSEHSLYAGSKFSCHSGALNMSIARANIGFIALMERNVAVSLNSLELAVKEQHLLLRDAHVTLISTMDHLVVANLLAGKKDKAIQMLRRMLHMQLDAFGPEDMRCRVTGNKISMLQKQRPPRKGGDEKEIPFGDLNNKNHVDRAAVKQGAPPSLKRSKSVLSTLMLSMRKKKG